MPPAAEVVKSRANPVFRRLKALKERADKSLVLLEGMRLVEEALGAGLALREVVASPKAAAGERGAQLLARAAATGAHVKVLDASLLASLSEAETSQGVLALADRPSFDEERLFEGIALVVVAVGIQNPGNLGALLRTAEAAGATGAYVVTGSADPLSWKTLRGSMGSAFRLPHVGGLSAEEALGRARDHGLVTVAAATDGTPYTRFDWRRPLALFLGNEGAGLPREIEAAAEGRVSIPMAGAVESLNVGAAAAVLLFEAARKRRG